MAIDTPAGPRPGKVASAGKALGGKAVGSGDAVLGVFDSLAAQLRFYVKIARALPAPCSTPRRSSS